MSPDIPDTSLPRSLENKTYFSCLLQQIIVLLRLPNGTSVLTVSRARKVTNGLMDMQLIRFFTLQHPMEFWDVKENPKIVLVLGLITRYDGGKVSNQDYCWGIHKLQQDINLKLQLTLATSTECTFGIHIFTIPMHALAVGSGNFVTSKTKSFAMYGVILERKNKRTRGIRLGEIVRRRNTVIGVVPRSPRMDPEEARIYQRFDLGTSLSLSVIPKLNTQNLYLNDATMKRQARVSIMLLDCKDSQGANTYQDSHLSLKYVVDAEGNFHLGAY
ncbi:hypothetical protein C5167_050691 [Papaver somniferum]|uniref:Uncharacterized protein n=1 Tax=Papaver somniferum TaxID=3469 RepID=A0A4Y7KSR7_PAPSO|nr:hypothetical protein C5167_050691 [Papaver somniferum]